MIKTLNIYLGKIHLGTFTININDRDGATALFTVATTPKYEISQTNSFDGTLYQLARLLGGTHFNYYQVIAYDTNPITCDDGTKKTPPYIDPPFGGSYQIKNITNQGADFFPWYWDNVDIDGSGYSLYDHVINDGKSIRFIDFPLLNDAKYKLLMFKTWLVCLDEREQPCQWLIGFQWQTFMDVATNKQRFIYLNLIDFPPSIELYENLQLLLC